jgi:hypothetical protein
LIVRAPLAAQVASRTVEVTSTVNPPETVSADVSLARPEQPEIDDRVPAAAVHSAA